MRQAIRETVDNGLSRIEITYSTTTKAGEDMMLSPEFNEEAEADLHVVHHALNKVEGICWKLPLKTILDHFCLTAKGNQLLIVRPALVAMIYA